MKSKFFFLGAISLLLASCSSELDLPVNLSANGKEAPLQLNVVEHPTKSIIESDALPTNSELGVYVTKSDGSAYSSESSSNNVKFTGSGDTYATNWTVDPNTPVMLNTEKATIYAYYPRQTSGVSLTSVPITNDGTDWMYTSAGVGDLTYKNPAANIELNHAMTLVRVRIKAIDPSTTGTVSSVSIKGDGYATSAKINLKTGTIGSYAGNGSQLTAENLGSLSTTYLSHDFWVISNEISSHIEFTINVGGDVFTARTESKQTLSRGNIYRYDIAISKSASSLLGVSVKSWKNSSNSLVGMSDGVYSINLYKSVVFPQDAKSTDLGVLVVDHATDQMFMIEKKGEMNNSYDKVKRDAGSDDCLFYWGSGSSDLSGISNIEDETAAANSFNGKANSEVLKGVLDSGDPDYTDYATVGVLLNEFLKSDYRNDNLRLNAWYIPSSGQMAIIIKNLTAINALLKKIGGQELYTVEEQIPFYWTSDELNDIGVWLGLLNQSSLFSYYKIANGRCRFVIDYDDI